MARPPLHQFGAQLVERVAHIGASTARRRNMPHRQLESQILPGRRAELRNVDRIDCAVDGRPELGSTQSGRSRRRVRMIYDVVLGERQAAFVGEQDLASAVRKRDKAIEFSGTISDRCASLVLRSSIGNGPGLRLEIEDRIWRHEQRRSGTPWRGKGHEAAIGSRRRSSSARSSAARRQSSAGMDLSVGANAAPSPSATLGGIGRCSDIHAFRFQ